MKNPKKYLVTGGAGFIGSALIEELLKRGHSVRALDNLSSGSLENLRETLSSIEFIEGDVRDVWTVREAVSECDYVFHHAALASVPRSIKNPQTTNAVNVSGTLNLLEASREFGIKRFVFASSSSVYGDSPVLPTHENAPTEPLTPYAVSKLTGEQYAAVYWRVHRLPTVSLRYFNVFGPRQNPKSEYAAVIPRFINAISNGERPTVFGDGEQTRDFIYISNVIDANLLCVESDDAVGGVYNIACGVKSTLNELIKELEAIIGKNAAPVFYEERKGDIRHSYADISRAQADLKFRPREDFQSGLAKTVEWFAGTKSAQIPTQVANVLKQSRIKLPQSLTFHDDDTVTSALLGVSKSRGGKSR